MAEYNHNGNGKSPYGLRRQVDSTVGDKEERARLKQNESRQIQTDPLEKKRKDQGHHEIEILGPGPEAAESAYSWSNCTKNPRHENFIPASAFRLEHLPPTHRTEEFLDKVRDLCHLTVRLKVTYTSRERPDGYAFSGHRGSNIPHYGSGCVTAVHPDQTCGPSHWCTISSSPCRTSYRISVKTACHVVYNSEEAAATRVELFHDDETSVDAGAVRTAAGLSDMYAYKKNDMSEFDCVTADEDVARRLKAVLERLNTARLYSWPHLKYYTLESSLLNKLAIVVVSHPHGQAKQVTVGKMVSVKVWSPEATKRKVTHQICEYSADTCPGSSGAPVFVFRTGSATLHLTSHSGCFENEKTNFSTQKTFFY